MSAQGVVSALVPGVRPKPRRHVVRSTTPAHEMLDRPIAAPLGGWAARITAPRVATAFRALAAVTWGLLVFGATVRVHGAGLSCPDWPLCFGRAIPELNFQVFLEWGHRVLAGTISVGFLGLAGVVLARPELRAKAGVLCGVSLAVLLTQIVLGGLTVLQLLAFWSVTLHLVTGNLFLLSLLTIASVLDPHPVAGSAVATGLAKAVAGMWLVQLALGGLVSSNYAGLACTEWPTCNGGVWFPAWSGIVGLQLAHRAGAYVLFALAAGLAWTGRTGPASGITRAVFAVVLAQVVLGVTNVLLEMPVEVAVLHSALADLIGITAVTAMLRLHAGAAPAGAR